MHACALYAYANSLIHFRAHDWLSNEKTNSIVDVETVDDRACESRVERFLWRPMWNGSKSRSNKNSRPGRSKGVVDDETYSRFDENRHIVEGEEGAAVDGQIGNYHTTRREETGRKKTTGTMGTGFGCAEGVARCREKQRRLNRQRGGENAASGRTLVAFIVSTEFCFLHNVRGSFHEPRAYKAKQKEEGGREREAGTARKSIKNRGLARGWKRGRRMNFLPRLKLKELAPS